MAGRASREYEVDVTSTVERVWQALTDPRLTEQYYFGSRVESDWRAGSPIVYRNAAGDVDIAGKLLSIEPPRRLETTFEPAWAPVVEARSPDRVSWELEPAGAVVRVRVVHHDFDPTKPGADEIDAGWRQILAGLRRVLES